MNKELDQKYIQARGRGNVAINTIKQSLQNRLAEVEKYHADFSAAGPTECAEILSWLMNEITNNLLHNMNLVGLANAQAAMSLVAHEMDEPKQPTILEFIEQCEASHFRTDADHGASEHAQIVLNTARGMIGLPGVFKSDLPKWDGKVYAMPEDSKLLANQKKAVAEPVEPQTPASRAIQWIYCQDNDGHYYSGKINNVVVAILEGGYTGETWRLTNCNMYIDNKEHQDLERLKLVVEEQINLFLDQFK